MRLAAASLVLIASCASTLEPEPVIQPLELEANGFVFDALAAGPEDGELVLLFHGFPQTGHSFRHQLAALGKAGYRAVAPDQRGYSDRARPTDVESYAVAHLSDDAARMADALGRDRFHVVGHDWGAAVAWFTAMRFPNRVKSVTALSVPHPYAFQQALASTSGDQAARSGYMARFREEGAAAAMLANDAAFLRDAYASPGITDADIEMYLEVLGDEAGLDAALNWYRAMTAGVPLGPLTQIEMPALYVWSDADSSMSREGAEATEDFIHGPYRFEVLEGVSHWIPEEAPERVNALLLEHLASVTDPAD